MMLQTYNISRTKSQNLNVYISRLAVVFAKSIEGRMLSQQ